MIIAKMITQDGGEPSDDHSWHLVQNGSDAYRIVCNGHVVGIGETDAKIIEKEIPDGKESGKITCDKCKKIIKWFKSIKL